MYIPEAYAQRTCGLARDTLWLPLLLRLLRSCSRGAPKGAPRPQLGGQCLHFLLERGWHLEGVTVCRVQPRLVVARAGVVVQVALPPEGQAGPLHLAFAGRAEVLVERLHVGHLVQLALG